MVTNSVINSTKSTKNRDMFKMFRVMSKVLDKLDLQEQKIILDKWTCKNYLNFKSQEVLCQKN